MVTGDQAVIVYGAGAIGSCVGGWLTPYHDRLYLLARGEHARVMRERGLTLSEGPGENELVRVRVVETLEQCPEAALVILAVKNYDLEGAARDVQRRYGDVPCVVGLQNGRVNQEILPRHFSKVVYGVIWFGAWRPEPGCAAYKRRGPISLGVPGPPPAHGWLGRVNELFGQGFRSEIAGQFQAAVHTKMILNLTNSLFTLVGHGYRPITHPRLLKKLTAGMLIEGSRIVQAQGFPEYTRGDNPSWLLLRLLNRLPEFIGDFVFKRDLDKLAPNSMAQDVLQYRRGQSELDSLNGYLVAQARELGIDAPVNDTVYTLCREHLAALAFKPIPEQEVWDRVQNVIRNRERRG